MSNGDVTGGWIAGESRPKGATRVGIGFIWRVVSPSARADLLNRSRSVDLATGSYIELAELIERAVVLPWHRLPEDLQRLLDSETICYYNREVWGANLWVEFI